MKAIAITDFGQAPELTEVATPVPASGEVLVRVHAASINGIDPKIVLGYMKDYMEHRFPLVPGKDFAGVVESVGEGVKDYSPGDRVFGVDSKQFAGEGSFGELLRVPVGMGLARLPEGVSFADGGALGLAGAAAHDTVKAADIAHKTVLVLGATGGVGAYAVQLATALGATVIATASGEEEKSFVTSLGARETVDYKQDVAAQVREGHPDGVDVILHFAGDPLLVSLLKSGGQLVSTAVMSPDQVPAGEYTVIPVFAQVTTDTLNTLAASVASKALVVPIRASFPLSDAPAALEAFNAGALGKISITIAE